MIALSRLRVQPYIVIKRGKYIKANRENNIMNPEHEKNSLRRFCSHALGEIN